MRNANKSPKIPSATVRKMEKLSGIRIWDRSPTKSKPALPIGRPNHNTKLQWNRLVIFSVTLTEWHTERQIERSHNPRLISSAIIVLHRRVLPPGELNDVIAEPLLSIRKLWWRYICNRFLVILLTTLQTKKHRQPNTTPRRLPGREVIIIIKYVDRVLELGIRKHAHI